ncbi:hypothetical protein DEAC_c31610 [Desulfosporosinus acididurans]|uniref:Uncharacterized protein n=1 Tax=Desulfosporosinus acididurans TaxID=476652 RepID=A0A0J1FPE3_9FIRM|nr:hypothetical protein [Desulfosporosinus acididurans]KLU64833.1 hypothetical protein DEAC_c31610 [Desulfosporosinus acididurans]
MVDKHAETEELRFGKESERKFLNSDVVISQDRPFSYYLKDATPCKVVFLSDSIQKELSGTLSLAPEGLDRLRKVTLVTDEEEFVLDIEQILGIHKIEND